MTGNSEKDDKLNVSFGDGTKIDGDLKIGNKSSISTGNINATGGGMVNIAGGDISQTITQSSSSPKQATLEDLTLMLDELTHLIGRAGLDNDIQVEAKDMVKKALDQLVAENPRKALVELRLKNMLDLVTAVGGADSAIAKIQDLVHRSVKIAGELFD